jgi:hypothetical protein
MKISLPGKIKNYLDLSLPRLLAFRRGWLYLLAVSVINVVMVYHLHPFGEPDPLLPHQPTLLTGFAWMCIGVYILLYQLLPVLMKRAYNQEIWTLAHEFRTLGIYFLLMLILNWVYASLVIPEHETNWHFFYKILCFTLLYQILLIVLATSICLIRHLLKMLMEHKSPEMPLVTEILPNTVLNLTEFHAGVYPLADIRYLKVDGNYTRIYFINNGMLKYDMVHLSLIKVYDQIHNHLQFIEISASIVVNLDNVTGCTGNSRGMRLKLRDCPEPVKVTRDYCKHIKQLLLERKMEK